MNKLFTAVLVSAFAVLAATAELVVVAEGAMYAGATNTVFADVAVALTAPVYYDSSAFYATGTNDVVLTLAAYDSGHARHMVSNATLTAGSGVGYVADGRTNAIGRIAMKGLTLSATKSAGATNGAPTSVFYRVYGDTE